MEPQLMYYLTAASGNQRPISASQFNISWLGLPCLVEYVKRMISQPLNTGQTFVSSLLRGPGDGRGRHIVGTQPGGGSFSRIELEDRNKATLKHIEKHTKLNILLDL